MAFHTKANRAVTLLQDLIKAFVTLMQRVSVGVSPIVTPTPAPKRFG